MRHIVAPERRPALQPERAADDLLHDLGGAAVDRSAPASRRTPGRRDTPPCSRSRRAAGGSGRRSCSAARWSTTWPRGVDGVELAGAWRARQWSTKTRAISTSVAISARANRLFWKVPIGWPNALRSLRSRRDRRRSDSPAAAADDRDRQPLLRQVAPSAGRSPGPPRRAGSAAAPARRRRTARRCPGRAGRSCRGCGRARSPPCPRSTTSRRDALAAGVGVGLGDHDDQVGVDAVGDERLLAVEHVVVAVATAVVWMPCRSEPAPGSVIAMAVISRRRRTGRAASAACCSSVALRPEYGAIMSLCSAKRRP